MQGDEVVYPVLLPTLLPAIIAGEYPERALRIDLAVPATRGFKVAGP